MTDRGRPVAMLVPARQQLLASGRVVAPAQAGGRALRLYLDSSAIVKRFLRRHRPDEGVTSTLSRVEVVRAVRSGGADALAQARRQLARLHQVNLSIGLLDAAASLGPGVALRSPDAIHLASAQVLGADLRSVVRRRLSRPAPRLAAPTGFEPVFSP